MITFINNIRSLKVSSIIVRSKWSKSHKPKLTLQGNWMTAAGFAIGEQVIIEVQNGILTIKKPNAI